MAIQQHVERPLLGESFAFLDTYNSRVTWIFLLASFSAVARCQCCYFVQQPLLHNTAAVAPGAFELFCFIVQTWFQPLE
jgi:hypothetical protein